MAWNVATSDVHNTGNISWYFHSSQNINLELIDLLHNFRFIFSIFYLISASDLSERDAIQTTISFFLLQNQNGIDIVTPTEQFFYTMIAFLGKENSFLDDDVNKILANFVQQTFKDPNVFNFETNLNGNG